MLSSYALSSSGKRCFKQFKINPLFSASPETLPICDVLKDPSRYNGKQIAVRGYESGSDEGVYLKGDCAVALETDGIKWPNLIWLVYPGSSFALHTVDFTLDKRSLDTAAAKVKAYKGPVRVWLTYVGLLETREPFSLQVYRDKAGVKRPAGFGNGAAAPAQFVIKTVQDVVVEKLPK